MEGFWFEGVKLNEQEKKLVEYISTYRNNNDLNPIDGPRFQGVSNIGSEDYHNKK